jgi:hypothetical protein
MEPELTCMATGHAVKKDWMTRQGTFGELVGGLSLRCSLMMVSFRNLLLLPLTYSVHE